MVDTVTLWLETCEAEKAVRALTEQRETIDRQTGEAVVTGLLKNLWVKASGQGVMVNGSLGKYYLGDNAQTLTRKTTAEALQALSDTLGLPMGEASLYRLDVAQNFLMKNALQDYYNQLGQARYYKRSEFADRQTIQYVNGRRALIFYDKNAELVKKKVAVPELFKGRNVLRYEARFLNRLPEQFERLPPVKASALGDEIFYIKALDKWRGEYFLIQKIARERALIMTNAKELERSLAFYGLMFIGGQDVALDLVRSAKLKGTLSKMQFQRLRAKVKEIAGISLNSGAPEAEAIHELDEKVKQAVNYYR